MKIIAVAFAAALAIGASMPVAQAAQNPNAGGTSLKVNTQGLLHAADELSARRGGGGGHGHGHRGGGGRHGWHGGGGGTDAVPGAVIATGMADAVMAGAATAATDTAATDGGLVIAFAGGSGVTAGWSRSAAGAAGKAKSESSGASAGAFSLLGVEI